MASKEKYSTVERRVKKKDKEGNPLKDTSGRYVYETVAIKYRVDADFVPSEIGQICGEFMDNYIEANKQGEWFVALLEKTEPKKVKEKQADGSEIEVIKNVPLSFMSIRSEFAKKFFPNIVKSSSSDNESYRVKMLKKYKK